MRITPLGSGLTVLIKCEATGADNFLAFAAWYSLSKNLPDAEVVIACRRPEDMEMDVFPWVYRIRVPFFYYRKSLDACKAKNPIFLISSDVMCLGLLDDVILDSLNSGVTTLDVESFCKPAKSSDHATFCSVKGGCGAFVHTNWIHKGGHPFGKVDLYSKGMLTVNEKRIFSLWKKLCPLYDNIV
jgi:hypothetical protein